MKRSGLKKGWKGSCPAIREAKRNGWVRQTQENAQRLHKRGKEFEIGVWGDARRKGGEKATEFP